MMSLSKYLPKCSRIILLACLGWAYLGVFSPNAPILLAFDPEEAYPDSFGQEALRLWSERERDRTVSVFHRSFWDAWFSKSTRKPFGFHPFHPLAERQTEDPADCVNPYEFSFDSDMSPFIFLFLPSVQPFTFFHSDHPSQLGYSDLHPKGSTMTGGIYEGFFCR